MDVRLVTGKMSMNWLYCSQTKEKEEVRRQKTEDRRQKSEDRSQEFKSSGVQEFRSSGVRNQESEVELRRQQSGVREFRSQESEVRSQKFSNPDPN